MTTILDYADELRLGQLSNLVLPTMPAGTPFLLKALTDENIDYIELAELIEKFPSIASKLISLVNSAWSSPAASISSLETTCSRLGLGVVRSTSIALAIATPFNPEKCVSFDPEYFWCSALLSADAASRLASISSSRSGLEPSSARAAGLLHNLGLLWLVDSLPAAVDQALTMVNKHQAESLQQALHHVLGFDQVEAGGRLAKSWDLPEALVEAMKYYPEAGYRGSQSEIVTTVGLATRLVSATLKQEPCPEPDMRLSSLGITQENFNDVFEQLNQQVDRIRAIAKVLT